jgi:multidrug/hemolysin transport system permease protein
MTNRSIKLYFRDKQVVFFSFLSMVILVALYFLFIANIYAESFEEAAPGVFAKKAQYFLIYLQMMAGVLVLNSVSLSLGVFAIIAKDFESRRTESFMLTKLKPSELQISYLLAAFIVSFVMNCVTWLVSNLLIFLLTGYAISFGAIAVSMGILAVSALVSCGIMLLVTALVKSSQALGVISGIAGAFLGFLSGVYLPYQNLGKTAETIGSLLPFTHVTIWLKQTVLKDAFVQIEMPEDMQATVLKDFFSAENIGFGAFDFQLGIMICIAVFVSIVALAVAAVLQKKRLMR